MPPRATSSEPKYLRPYLDAAREHGAGFGSLLWTNPGTQALRFEAIIRMEDLSGRQILDAGCGRADFLDFLASREIRPAHYVGIEAIQPLYQAAVDRRQPECQILLGDFVQEPLRLFVGADAIIFCGSLNTIPDQAFWQTLRYAMNATAESVIFNYLCDQSLAQADWLYWRSRDVVMDFCRTISRSVNELSDYFPGDCTIRMSK